MKTGGEAMRRQKHFGWVSIMVIVGFLVLMGWSTKESSAAAEKYPTKPIQIVIGFQPGLTDVCLRIFTDKLPEYLGQPVSFVYKPGANSAIGASFVAKSKPDGYTLFGTSSPSLITPPLTQEGAGYTIDDFVPICNMTSSLNFIVVRADSPWKNLKDIIEEAKKSPGKLTYSSAGTFAGTNIAMEVFLKMAGINITHVPCLGSNPAVTALLGGHVSMSSQSFGATLPHIQAGTLRIIALFGKERLKEFPDVPTFFELGYPAVMGAWYGILAPKGTPEEVVKTIYKATEKAFEVHKKSIEDMAKKLSLKVDFMNPEEYANYLKTENELFTKAINELKKTSK
jgi:tripartite-type tricarboxylate transporter receptor subunit TctC